MKSLLGWFDLYEDRRRRPHVFTLDGEAPAPQWYELALVYLAIILGILGKGLLDFFASEQVRPLPEFIVWRRIIPAVVVSIVILPSVYKNVMSQRKKEVLPFLIELATVFSLGIGYKSIFDAAVS